MLVEEVYARIQNMEAEETSDFMSYVDDLIQQDELSDPDALDIGKRISLYGMGEISKTELLTFIEKGILADNYQDECDRCYQELNWTEMLNALVQSGLCSNCVIQQERIMEH